MIGLGIRNKQISLIHYLQALHALQLLRPAPPPPILGGGQRMTPSHTVQDAGVALGEWMVGVGRNVMSD